MNTRKMAALALGAATLIPAACEAAPPPVWAALTPAATSATDGTATLVVGDSIEWQAGMSQYLTVDGTEYYAYMGWKIDDVQPKINERRDNGSLGKLVLMLGTNDADPTWNGGWDRNDEMRWLSAVTNLNPDTKVAIVLPYICDAAPAAKVAETNEARAYLTLLAQTFDLGLVDWKDYATEPGVLGPDCIHLDATGNAAYTVTVVAGTARSNATEDAKAALADVVETAIEVAEVPET